MLGSKVKIWRLKKKIGADECYAAFALTSFLTTLVNISSPVLFYFIQFLAIEFC